MIPRFVMLLVLALAVVACATPPSSAIVRDPIGPGVREATMYRSATCACCHEYEAILEAAGWTVEVVEIDDTAAFKTEHGIPEEAWSCHTMVMAGYVVEGHVPLTALDELLERKPAIDGIALPGMPAGSPGMGGDAAGPFEVLAIQAGETKSFGRH